MIVGDEAEEWAFSSSQHARDDADNVESYLKKKGIPFPKSCDSLLSPARGPESGIVPDLIIDDATDHPYLSGFL